MPRKKPCTTTPTGTLKPNALKLAQRIAMLAAQKPIAPATASPPREGCPTRSKAVLSPCEAVAGTVASLRASPALLWPWAKRAMRRSMSCGISAIAIARRITIAAIAAGTIVTSTAFSPLSTPVRNRTPQTISASGYQMYWSARKATIRVADFAASASPPCAAPSR